MNVTLNIENDAELRAYIKECIKGQVLSIVRKDFVEMVQRELERKIKNTDQYNFNVMLREACKEAVAAILYKEHNVGTWSSDFIKPFVDAKIDEAIEGKDWKLIIDQLAKEKIRSLI